MKPKLKKILRDNQQQLENSPKDLRSIYQILFSHPELICCEANDGFRIQRLTFGRMRDRITQAAGALYQRLGAKGSYIALEMENCPEWIVAFWAILVSGNKPYLVNMRYPQSLTEGILKTLQVEHILCLGESKLPGQVISLKSLPKNCPAAPEEVFADEIAFSSSATSMKEVICFYSGAQISSQILNFDAIVKENPRIAAHYKGQLKQLAFLPFYHVFGLFAVYFWFSFFGRTMVFLRDYSADTILKTCRRHQVTHIFAVPMLWHTVEQQIWATVKEMGQEQEEKLKKGLALMTKLQNICPTFGSWLAKRVLHQVTDKLFGKSVMFCINGGSYLRDSALQLLNGIGYSMHNGYGMSEIGITSVELRHKPKHRNLNSIGHPFKNVRYRLDEAGILWVKGGTLCTKKLVNGEPVTLDEWFNTGDNMRVEDGHYFILGRLGDVVIGENGENINPDMVEKRFRLDGAAMLCVLGLPGENGQELSLVVQLKPYATQNHVNSLREQAYAINETLPAATAVKRFYFTAEEIAPPTAVKVSRLQLLKKIESGQVTLTAFRDMQIAAAQAGEESPLQQKVRSVIVKVLGVEEAAVTLDAHLFYDLGATSIQYFTLLSALAEEFGITGYDKNDQYCYTLRDISQYIERRM